jgi:hypothetical protein
LPERLDRAAARFVCKAVAFAAAMAGLMTWVGDGFAVNASLLPAR